MAVTAEQLNQLYLAYFGRPMDFDGYVFYTTKPGFDDIWDVAAAFSQSPESQALYGPTFNAAQINAIYQNLFNRDAEPDGLLYWTTEVTAGRITPAGAAYAILLGAQNEDAIAVQNKLAAAQAFFDALDTSAELLGYSGQDAAALARAWLATVDWTTTSLEDALANLEDTVAAVVDAGGTIGQTYTLTSTVDSITITDATTINTINGVIDGTAPANSTFTVGDNIVGNGKTLLNLAVADDGTAAFATVKNVKEVNLTTAATGTLDIAAINWTGVGSVNLVGGVDGLNVDLTGLQAGTGLSVGAAVAGTIEANYTNGSWAWLGTDKGSSLSYKGGNVTGSVDAGGWAGMYLSDDGATNGVALTVGDVTIAGNKGASGWFSMWNNSVKAGDMTAGNISVTGNSDSWIGLGNYSQTAAAPAVNVTAGNLTAAGSDTGDWAAWIGAYNTGAGSVGNLTVGNVDLTVSGKNGWGSITLSMDAAKSAGNLTAGNITATASGVGSDINIDIQNSVSSTGANNAVVGNVTLGDVSLSVGQDASISFTIDQYAYAGGTGNATAGNFVMGNKNVDVAQGGYFYASIEAPSAYASGGTATVGNVTVGNRTYNVAVDATASVDAYWGYASNGGGKASTVGNVVLGDLTANVGINASADFEEYIDAYGSTASKIGNITQGAVNFNVDDGGYLSYSLDVESDGTIGDITLGSLTGHANVSADLWAYWSFSADKGMGNVSVGDVTLSTGVNGSVSVSYTFYASADKASIGNVSFGNVSMTAGEGGWMQLENDVSADTNVGNITIGNVSLNAGKDAYVYASHSISAWDGAVGTVNVGDISTSAAAGGTATYELWVYGETAIGNIAIGNIDITANGDGAYAEVSMSMENDGDGSIGTTTVGDIAMSANGANAGAYFYLSVSSADNIGAMTVGNLDLSVGNAAKKTNAWVSADIGNWDGTTDSDIVVGNINLTGTSVRGVGDNTMTYWADVSIWSENGDITVGNITVSGGDGKADNFATLTNWLSVSSTNGTETIGNVDYSGYGAAATIDVSGWLGAAQITGGAKDDTITDNKGTNSLTGGAGADTFVFLNTNTGLTAATADVINDFNNAAGDKIDLDLSGGALTVGRYGEASYADFAAFVTGANAADRAVWVGQVGGSSYVAVDHNEDGTVDFMIQLAGVSLTGVDVASFV